jgi:predicted enzyme related to lactoylglutathione lyase
MSSPVRGLVPVVYVRDLAASGAFYRLLGFTAAAAGRDDGNEWNWSYLQSAEHGILLAAGNAPIGPARGPVQLYLQVDDVTAAHATLVDAGAAVEHLGYPDHAPGGELRATDPDGQGVLIGQTTAVAKPEGAGNRRAIAGFGALREAASALHRRGIAPRRCDIGILGGGPCDRPAEVKLADSWGETAWSCIDHADEVMINAPGVFLAIEDSQGLTQFLRMRRGTDPAPVGRTEAAPTGQAEAAPTTG